MHDRSSGRSKLPRGPADLSSRVIVDDMWLTGVDTPSLCPMYMGKPMRR
jgi:type I site-specific restriction-modification system R (restriction) subunit